MRRRRAGALPRGQPGARRDRRPGSLAERRGPDRQDAARARAGHGVRGLRIARHRSAASRGPQIIETLINIKDSRIKTVLGQRDDLSEKFLLKIAEDPALHYILADRSDLSKNITQKIIENKDPKIRSKLAQNPYISNETMEALYRDSNFLVNTALVENENLSEDIAIKMIENPSLHIFLAKKPFYYQKLFTALYQKAERWIKRQIVSQKNLPTYLLDLTLASDDSLIQETLIRFQNIPPDKIGIYVNSSDVNIRIAVATHYPNIKDIYPLINDECVEVRLAIANRKDLEGHHCLRLSTDSDDEVCIAIAKNPVTPSFVVRFLVLRQKPKIKLAIANRKNLSEIIVEQLSKDENTEIQNQVMKRFGMEFK